jgi:hypothetical protein
MENSYLSLANVIFWIPQFLLLLICIYFISKKRASDSILLIVGSSLGLFSTYLDMQILKSLNINNKVSFLAFEVNIHYIVGLLGFVSSLIFALGLFLLIHKTVKNVK